MNLEQVIKDVNDKKASINKKYNIYMDRINGWMREIEDIPNKFSQNSKQYQEQQKKRLEDKILKAQNDVEEWLQKQTDNIEKWLAEKQDKITKQLEKAAEDLLTSRKEFAETEKNEQIK